MSTDDRGEERGGEMKRIVREPGDGRCRVLFVGAHHEEIEGECPNIAAALALAGCRVVILNPVGGWNWSFIRSLGKDGRERTIADALAAARALGCEKVIWDYPIAQLDRHQGEILDRLAAFFVDFQPDICLMHWPLDSHADHRFVAKATRQAMWTAPAMVPGDPPPEYSSPQEVYAFQTGVAQAYGFVPDFLVKTDAQTMAIADRAVECFFDTAREYALAWRDNYRAKAAYWSHLLWPNAPAEALKFLGPKLPTDGFLLKRILKDRMVSAPYEPFFDDPALQI